MNAAAESRVLDIVAKSALQLEQDIDVMGWDKPFGSIYGLDLPDGEWAFFRRIHDFKENPDIEFSGLQMQGFFRHPSQRSSFKHGCAVALTAINSDLYRKALRKDQEFALLNRRLEAGLIDSDQHRDLIAPARRRAHWSAKIRAVGVMVRGHHQPVIVQRTYGEQATVSNTPNLNFTAHLQMARSVLIDSK